MNLSRQPAASPPSPSQGDRSKSAGSDTAQTKRDKRGSVRALSLRAIFYISAALSVPALAALWGIRPEEIDYARARGADPSKEGKTDENSSGPPPRSLGSFWLLMPETATWRGTTSKLPSASLPPLDRSSSNHATQHR